MTFTSPIPKPFSMAYGEMSVLLGVLFLGAAWALTRGWSLLPLSIYAFFAGGAAIVIGVRFIDLSLTPMPLLPGAGFILTGLGGVGAGIVLWKHDAKALRLAGVLVMLAAAGIWAFTAVMAYWTHMKVERSQTATSWLRPPRHADPSILGRGPSLSRARVSGTASGTATKLAHAAIRQYRQKARYHAHWIPKRTAPRVASPTILAVMTGTTHGRRSVPIRPAEPRQRRRRRVADQAEQRIRDRQAERTVRRPRRPHVRRLELPQGQLRQSAARFPSGTGRSSSCSSLPRSEVSTMPRLQNR